MMTKKSTALLFLWTIVCLFNMTSVRAQDDSEPTTVSNVADTVLPWGAQRIAPAKIPAEFNDVFEKMLAEGRGKIVSEAREILVWEAKQNAAKIKSELQANFRKENWSYETAGREGDVEFFSLLKDAAPRGAILGFFAVSDGVLVCALMKVKEAVAPASQTSEMRQNQTATGSIVGRWFRTVGGSTIDWTGKTTLKGGEDFTFEFFADGTVEYTHKKEILNIMQCRINSQENARGRYSLNGSALTINLGAMKSVGTNSCNTKENYNKTLGDSTITVQIQIKELEDITRPDKPWTMCFDDSREVCYERQK